jgi:predicted ATP-binding protein involved in virulence
MKIEKLELFNLRAFDEARFEFQSGMNLLVGVNGVGKTTVLDALRVCLSRILPQISSTKSRKLSLEVEDIKQGKEFFEIFAYFSDANDNFRYQTIKYKNKYIEGESGSPRKSTYSLDDSESFSESFEILKRIIKKTNVENLAVFYSTKRSIIGEQRKSSSATIGGIASAFSESLSPNREFSIFEFAQWFKVQNVLRKESPIALKHILALEKAIELFLPGFKNLRLEEADERSFFVIDKNGTTLNLNQLSDGERGVISMVLDLARRLSQANPNLKDPLAEGTAIVLIDELDLHLHPKWQRTIVDNLTRTFPNCQFIATTHSPQIIPSLEPENILLLKDNEVIRPDRTKGMDTNWILRFLMDADERPQESNEAIKQVEALIDEVEFDAAKKIMAEFRSKGFDLPEWSMLEARIARFELLGEEE